MAAPYYTGPLTIMPRYQGSMKGRPGVLVAWAMAPSIYNAPYNIDGYQIVRHVSGQTGTTMLRMADIDHSGTKWDYVPGFVPRFLQHAYNDQNQIFGTYSVRARGQTVPCNANQVIRTFSFHMQCPSARSDKTVKFQIYNPSGDKVWESQKKTIPYYATFEWFRENPNFKVATTGNYRLVMMATSQTSTAQAFKVSMDSRNPYPWGNAVYYWDGGQGINAAWYNNPGWSMTFDINGSIMAYVDHYCPGSAAVTYWVYPYDVNHNIALYKSGVLYHNQKGVWLIPTRKWFGNRITPELESLAVCIRSSSATSPIEFATPEHQQIYRPIGKRIPVIKSIVPPGYDFTITGHIRDYAGLSGDEYKRRLEILYGYTNEIKIMFVGQGMSFPVAINNLRIKPIKQHWYEVSLDCYQTGHFTIPEVLTVGA
jgi:hypothetical protein